MITTYNKYSMLRDLGLVIDRGLVNDNGIQYHCYDNLDTQETCHYSVAERDEDLVSIQAIFK